MGERELKDMIYGIMNQWYNETIQERNSVRQPPSPTAPPKVPLVAPPPPPTTESSSLPSNTEPNPREQLNAINIQDDGVVEPEPEPRQETVVSKGQGEVDQNTNKSVNVIYKPRVPYPNTQGKTTQMKNLEISLKEVQEPLLNNSRGSIHEERMPQIEELDEWRTHTPRTHDKQKLRQNEPDTFPNQLKVGDKVLLDATDPHIVTTTPNEEIPLTVLRIFPFGMVEVSHPKFGTFKVNNTRLKPYFKIDSKNEKYKLLKPP
ncbi:hypothetical protein GOBAR_AA35065 [Gossypium barbadense]|uniref:Uncharacterized protein n=1 Tax=Gossypium barbadense TaxID=3634 RepID=A0A2P5W3F0_GOSBA|nr:hypothetical protein GOBAR_AA35065 [Gossypium barbadense]